ncbi:DUF6541 family protein [Microbacterium sp. nov. GSS16]|uniref:DUF6541 family protein n=1 Tax=Microbacterium sp. nov. GSS16 TaxID=3019890 RepID=UPI0023063A96|nr:DUF6541 family protein [Microbacterium sp. nov. GSS16]WCD92546.1 hypothetical protein PGB26_12995 [Microbacterium sp. nov. GSS16]
MGWLNLALAVITVIGVILIPGFLLSSALGMRGFARLALAAPAGTTVVVMAALIGPVVDLPWGLLPIAVTALALTAVVAVIRLVLTRFSAAEQTSERSPTPFLLLGGAAIVVLIQLSLVIESPENFSQTFDNIFHLNAVRYALDTGSVSPLTIGSMTSAPSGGLPFYPSGWHAVTAIAVQIAGVSIPVASNAVMFFYGAVAWPTAILFLVSTLFGSGRSLLVTAAAMSVATPAFPLLMIDYGVLLPYMMGLSLVAVPTAMLIQASRCTTWGERVRLIVAALGSLPGIAVAHPGALVVFLVFTGAILLILWVRLLAANASPRAKIMASIWMAAFVILAAGLWYVLRPPAAARTWLTTETVGQAIGEVLTGSVWFAPVNIVLAGLVVMGGGVALRRRRTTDWIAIALFVVAAGLYIVVSGLPYLELRDIITGAWYNNAPRLAAVLPLAWIPLAAIGGERLWSLTHRAYDRGSSAYAGRVLSAASAVIVLFVVPQAWSMRQAVTSAHGAFAVTDTAQLVTSDELALIERLDDETPEDAVILGSPWTGTGLAYALADRRVVMPHTLMDITEDMETVLLGLDDPRPGSAVCDAIYRLGINYVLDFGTQEVNGGQHPYDGLDELSDSDSVKEIDRVGDAVLYQVVLCD